MHLRRERFMATQRLSLTALSLLAANLIPLLGVMFAGWSLFELVVLYWLENLVIGAINVLRMATCSPDIEHLRLAQQTAASGAEKPKQVSDLAADLSAVAHVTAGGHHLMKLFFIPFFSVHYGMFCLVHGVFIFVLLGGGGPFGMGPEPFGGLRFQVVSVLSGGLWVALLGLVVSHLFSYIYYFLYLGEYRRTNAAMLMMAPYGRIVVLHVAILFGAFATHLLGQPLVLLLLLIVGKTLLDWSLHRREHRVEDTLHTR